MQRSTKTVCSGILALVLFIIASPLVRTANAQDNAPATTKPAPPENVNVAKAQPSSPDTPSPRVAPVKPDSYIIGAEDILTISVWKEPDMSHQVPVRPDGMISLPLLGDIKASGLTPLQLQDQITSDMKKYISDPQVTVIVNQVNSLNFNVVGEVLKPGYYPLTRHMTILDAIAISGGFRDFAKSKKIYVLRTQADGKQVKIPFNYKKVITGKDPKENIELQPHDTLVVP